MRTLILIAALLLSSRAHADETSDALTASYQLEGKRDYAGAVKSLKKLNRTYFIILRIAYLDALAGDAKGAAESYRAASELQPSAVEPLLGQQLALVTLANWPEAIAVGVQVLALDVNSYLGRSRLAWSLYKHKDYAQSVEQYRAVVKLYPGDVEMRVGLGWALLGISQKAEAAQTFRDVLAMVPKHQSATDGLAAALK
jgi:tetratricopeptide (TPR) repeat protein